MPSIAGWILAGEVLVNSSSNIAEADLTQGDVMTGFPAITSTTLKRVKAGYIMTSEHQASASTPEEPAEAALTCGDVPAGIPTSRPNTLHFVKIKTNFLF